LRAHAGSVEAGPAPGSMKLHHAKTILHRALDQRRPILDTHGKIVVAERLQTKLNAANIRPVRRGGGLRAANTGNGGQSDLSEIASC